MKRILYAILLVSFIAFTLLGVQNLRQANHKVQLKEIQLKDTSVQLQNLNEEYNKLLQQKEVDQQKLKELEEQKKKLEADLQAKAERQEQERLAVQRASTFTKVAQAVGTDKQELMRQAGIADSDWAAVDYIVSKESSWVIQWNKSGSGAYGLCQALPASKMASAGADYMTNPVTQLKWCDNYAKARYGGWWSAYAFWQQNSWW